jgi:hypothetical protein
MAVEDTSTLQAALKSTLVLDKGTGNPTFTRTTTKRIFNDEGLLVRVLSGAAAFGGARVQHNMLTHSELIIGQGWSIGASTTVTDNFAAGPPGTGIANCSRLNFPAGSGTFVHRTDITPTPGYNGILSFWGKSNDENTYSVYSKVGGTVDASGGSTLSFTPSWQRFTVAASTFTGSYIHLADPVSSLAADILIAGMVYEEKADSAVASDYLTVGVLSNPYHGAGVDGVKWHDTDSDEVSIPDATLTGYLSEPAATNLVLHCRDATNASWTKTNITAALDQTGIDNAANLASSLTATAANGTCLQAITTSGTRSLSGYVKRLIGTGPIEITRDNGTSWTAITSSINSSTYTRVSIQGTSVTNPNIGFRIVTSGDAIAIDYVQDETGDIITTPILTTTASVTRNEDILTYQTTSNISDTEGAIAARIKSDDWATISGTIGSATTGLAASSSNAGVQALDGTNTVNGPEGTPTGLETLAIGWYGTILKAVSGGVIGTSGSYDGSFNLSTIALGIHGNIRDLNIWTVSLTDSELSEAGGGTGVSIFDNDGAKAVWLAAGFTGSYNDMQMAYLKNNLSKTGGSNSDLLAAYLKAKGEFLI